MLVRQCFSQNITKQVNNSINLTSYGNLYGQLKHITSDSNAHSYNHEKTAISIATHIQIHFMAYHYKKERKIDHLYK